ncbi:MAG TPA: hypothetical protein VLK24_00530 [Gaiellaceae bacterium]|nr:hypothetical protein [Gaiellaceae bacterium]
MRELAVLGAVLGAILVGQAFAGRSSPPTVPCSDIIGQAKTARGGGYRLVLGVVSVPPARLTQVVASGSTRWPYWRKAGLVVRASSLPVRVAVPRAWRTRAAISWGSSGTVAALTIAACPSPPQLWNAYAGGFLLRARRECVPLTFTVGRRSQTVRFGLGGRCRRP